MGYSEITRNGTDTIEPHRVAAGNAAGGGNQEPASTEEVEAGRRSVIWDRLYALPSRLHQRLIEALRSWLGINAHEVMLQSHINLIYDIAVQGHDTARAVLESRMDAEAAEVEFEKLKRRVLFYAEHCDSLSFAHRRFQKILEAERLQAKEK